MNKRIVILLIEDDADDVEILVNALKTHNVDFELQLLQDGEAAVSFFQDSQNSSFPDIIIMDLNLPRIHGREILVEYNNSRHAHIPLIVFTTSSSKDDELFATKNRANKFLIKPNTIDGLSEVINSIKELTSKN